MRRALFAAVALVAGCYNPSFNNPSCPTGECPDGFTCVQGQCVQGNGGVDAPSTDTPNTDNDATDAPIDAIDAPGTTAHTGQISVVENAFIATDNSILGQGIIVGINFQPAMFSPPVYEERPGNVTGCKVYMLDDALEITNAGGINEGRADIVVSNPGQPVLTFPSCAFDPSPGRYRCIDGASSGPITASAPINVSPMGPSLTVVNTTIGGPYTFGPEDVGRYVTFSGATQANLNNRPAAIVNYQNPNTVILALSGVVAESISSGTIVTEAGSAIEPARPDPGQLDDGAAVTLNVVGDATTHLGTFMASITNVADDFTMDAATTDLMHHIPSDGSMFSVNCSACGGALLTILQIRTTDAQGLFDQYAFPPPMARSVQMICAEVGATQINVPAQASSYLLPAMSNATRILANYMRVEVAMPPNAEGSGNVNVVAGHGIIGVTVR
jgi:hypothetical protein